MSYTKADLPTLIEQATQDIEGPPWTQSDIIMGIKGIALMYQGRDKSGKCRLSPRILNALSALFRELYAHENNGEYPPDPPCGLSFDLIHKWEN